MRPSVSRPDRDGDRRAGVDDLGAARQAVGRVHRDRADAVVAQVLLDLADEPVVDGRGGVDVLLGASGLGTANLDRVVDLGQLVGEHGLDHDALDLFDPAHVLGALPFCLLGFCCGCHLSPRLVSPRADRRYPESPSAPPTTSKISWVISAWRARFISSVRSSINVLAFSDALRIAVIRAPCSDAVDSSSAR